MRISEVAVVTIPFALVALSAGCTDGGSGEPTPEEALVQYFSIQIGTYHPAYINDSEPYDPNAAGDAPAFPIDDVDSSIGHWLSELGGERGDETHRLAFMVGPLALDHTDEQLREAITATFELAVEHGVAVGIHIDDSMYWQRRRDLWQSPENVEWLDWNGTPNTGRVQSWGGETQLAPQMCFNSTAVTAEIRRIARDVVGAQIATEVARLDDPDLFAGVIMGWETLIGKDYATHSYVGYCALSNRGFSAGQPPSDIDLERERVVQEFIEVWAGALGEGGVDSTKIYSHIAYAPASAFARLMQVDPSITYSEFAQFATPWTAFGSTHNAGYSLYAVELPQLLLELLEERGNPPWAHSEGAPAGPGEEIPDADWERFLAARFNHGATLVNLFPHGTGPAAAAAFQKFLRGETLSE